MYVFGYPIGASTPISANHLVANEAGIYFKDYQGPLSNNTIADNRKGIVNNQGTYPAGLEISGNNLFRNEEYHLSHLRTDVLTATNNYWGATVATVIADGIYDYYDDFDLGVVDYTGYLSDTVLGAPVSPPTGVEVTLHGADVHVRWSCNPESDTAGYKVHYDSDSGYPYANAVDVSNVTSTTVTNVSPSVHFFAVTAYDSSADGTTDWTDGNESWFSNEVVLALVVTPPADQKATEGNPASFALGSFADPITGTSWEVTVEWGDGTADTVFTVSTSGGLGNRTHTYGADGTYAVAVTVDNGSDSHSATFKVDVSPQSSGNDAPSFSSSPDLAAVVGVLYSYQIVASDPDAGDVMTITALVKPSWLQLTPTGSGTASLSGEPGPSDVGKHPVLLRVLDQAGASYTQYFTIVVSAAPAATGIVSGTVVDADVAGIEGVTVTLSNEANAA